MGHGRLDDAADPDRSRTCRPDLMSTTEAMHLAMTELVGTIKSTALGLLIQPLKGINSLSNSVARVFHNPEPRGVALISSPLLGEGITTNWLSASESWLNFRYRKRNLTCR